MPTGYEREYTTGLGRRIRRRVGFSTERGEVTRFVVQIEYWLDGEWGTVVRFDHDSDSEMGHDVTEDGLHLDVYRDGEKYFVVDEFPRIDLSEAIAYCESHLEAHADRYIRRFERWHNVNDHRDR